MRGAGFAGLAAARHVGDMYCRLHSSRCTLIAQLAAQHRAESDRWLIGLALPGRTDELLPDSLRNRRILAPRERILARRDTPPSHHTSLLRALASK